MGIAEIERITQKGTRPQMNPTEAHSDCADDFLTLDLCEWLSLAREAVHSAFCVNLPIDFRLKLA